MAHQDIERLMNNVRVRCPGATLDAMQLELFAIMDKFFKGSNVWTEDIQFNVAGGDFAGTVYQITATGPCLIDKLMWCYSKPSNPNDLRGSQVFAFMSRPGEITLRYQPSDPQTYLATVALTVDDPTQRDGYVTFPKWVLDKYREDIFNGFVGRMLAIPSKPWTNNQLSVYHLRLFETAIGQARVEAQRNNLYRAQAWKYPGFAGGSQTKGRGGFFPPQ